MKKVLGQKLYDTNTAEIVGEHLDCNEYKCEVLRLYRKKNGELFIYFGFGTATEDWKADETSYHFYNEYIVPVKDECAKTFLKEWLDTDIYMNIFGPVEE